MALERAELPLYFGLELPRLLSPSRAIECDTQELLCELAVLFQPDPNLQNDILAGLSVRCLDEVMLELKGVRETFECLQLLGHQSAPAIAHKAQDEFRRKLSLLADFAAAPEGVRSSVESFLVVAGRDSWRSGQEVTQLLNVMQAERDKLKHTYQREIEAYDVFASQLRIRMIDRLYTPDTAVIYPQRVDELSKP